MTAPATVLSPSERHNLCERWGLEGCDDYCFHRRVLAIERATLAAERERVRPLIAACEDLMAVERDGDALYDQQGEYDADDADAIWERRRACIKNIRAALRALAEE